MVRRPLTIASAVLLILAGSAACSRGGEVAPRAELAPAASLNWARRSAAPNALFEAQGAAVGNRLYVFGGFYNSRIQATTRSYRYDASWNGWKRLADMPEEITHAGVAVVGKTVYLAGGFIGDHNGSSTSHVWKYNTASDSWTRGPSLPARRGGARAPGRRASLLRRGGEP